MINIKEICFRRKIIVLDSGHLPPLRNNLIFHKNFNFLRVTVALSECGIFIHKCIIRSNKL